MRLCLLRSSVTIEDYQRDTEHRRHTHVSRDEADVLIDAGVAQWLEDDRVLQKVPSPPDKISHLLMRTHGPARLRGLSCGVGQEMANVVERLITARVEGRRVALREWDWVLTWLRDMNKRRPHSSRTFKRWRKE